MFIEITFDHAEEISIGQGRDVLAIKVIDNEENTSLFTSEDSKETLDPASYVMLKEI